MQCGAKKRDGEPCKTLAMANGRCRMHGGKAGRPVESGRYSLKHRAALEAKAQVFLSDPSPGDLTGELALMRTLLQDYLDRFPDNIPMSLDDIQGIYGMLDNIGKTVERIAKILNQTALTQAEVQLLQARLTDLALKYVDASRRDDFFAELSNSFSGGRGVEQSNRLA